jgi:hypothetical protein
MIVGVHVLTIAGLVKREEYQSERIDVTPPY